jgi:hypothetical protein
VVGIPWKIKIPQTIEPFSRGDAEIAEKNKIQELLRELRVSGASGKSKFSINMKSY